MPTYTHTKIKVDALNFLGFMLLVELTARLSRVAAAYRCRRVAARLCCDLQRVSERDIKHVECKSADNLIASTVQQAHICERETTHNLLL